jgi:hypothetical protein
MTEAMNELFENNQTTKNGKTAGKRALAGTAQLVDFSSTIANKMMTVANQQIDTYKERILASQSDNAALDALIADMTDEKDICDEIEILKGYDEGTLQNMLKSQQSKRSRARHNAMTQDNYKTLVAAAVAEKVIRGALGKVGTHTAGSHTGVGRATALFTEEELDALRADQARLRAEIRNVQSKKSVAKKTEGYESTEHWALLVEIENQLMAIRDPNFKPAQHVQKQVVKVDETKNQLADLLAGIDLNHMKSADKTALLAKIAAMTAGEATQELETNEEGANDASAEL